MSDSHIVSEQEVMEYLEDELGEEFINLIYKPSGYKVGERLLYKMKDSLVPERKEPTQHELDEMQQEMLEFAEKTGASAVTFTPPKTSGSSLVRMVDIPNWGTLMFPDNVFSYANSDNLEMDDFAVEWLLGLVFFSRDKMLFNIDFTHPQVRAAFIVTYSDEYGRADRGKTLKWYKKYRHWLQMMKNELSNNVNTDIRWAKLIQREENLYFVVKHK
jgi:hypothetical protein